MAKVLGLFLWRIKMRLKDFLYITPRYFAYRMRDLSKTGLMSASNIIDEKI